jgi:peptide/nickel transport system ATP-binding protein/oligopeptide transport system ATP-binding protein
VVFNVSLEVENGETFAIVGESGSGKSTLAKALVKLIPVENGSIQFDGTEVAPLKPAEFHPFRKKIQLVFQDPWQAVNPRLKVEDLLMEPLVLHAGPLTRSDHRKRVLELLETVHLSNAVMDRYSSELSGGQRQRILLARALAVEPELLICDEPVSALDVSIQSQLLDLLKELKESRGLTLLFISHDLAVVQQMADHVMVMQNGKAVESRTCQELFRDPHHEYTRMLLDACPKW